MKMVIPLHIVLSAFLLSSHICFGGENYEITEISLVPMYKTLWKEKPKGSLEGILQIYYKKNDDNEYNLAARLLNSSDKIMAQFTNFCKDHYDRLRDELNAGTRDFRLLLNPGEKVAYVLVDDTGQSEELLGMPSCNLYLNSDCIGCELPDNETTTIYDPCMVENIRTLIERGTGTPFIVTLGEREYKVTE